jgi:hypothetical protein
VLVMFWTDCDAAAKITADDRRRTQSTLTPDANFAATHVALARSPGPRRLKLFTAPGSSGFFAVQEMAVPSAETSHVTGARIDRIDPRRMIKTSRV